MTLTESRVNLIHRCTIQRNEGETDAWGGSGTPDWQDNLTDVPCRAWSKQAQESIDPNRAPDRVVVLEFQGLVLPRDTDVVETDRILSVTDRQGDVVLPGPMRIQAVQFYRDHLELLMEQTR